MAASSTFFLPYFLTWSVLAAPGCPTAGILCRENSMSARAAVLLIMVKRRRCGCDAMCDHFFSLILLLFHMKFTCILNMFTAVASSRIFSVYLRFLISIDCINLYRLLSIYIHKKKERLVRESLIQRKSVIPSLTCF